MTDKLIFAEEQDSPVASAHPPWKILIVDDDEEVHSITRLALKSFQFDGRPLLFLHAHSGQEGLERLREHPDVALCLLDVVMETENAGLTLVESIRTELNNHFVRIVLRTGQPGQAPEETIIADYDINDYKEKTELTRGKLHTLLFSCLRSYRDIIALDRSRQGLERILEASTRLHQKTYLSDFAAGILQQISAILAPDEDALYALCDGIAAHESCGEVKVVAATGAFTKSIGHKAHSCLPASAMSWLNGGEQGFTSVFLEEGYLCLYRSNEHHLSLLFLQGLTTRNALERHLLEVFCQNALTAFENMALQAER
ncbi:MAG: DUF3369 domain-containing protein [Saccharospirillum sp.]|nr:DUF3369 domain-containing protein [Saccharospirillum sp.]